MSDEYTKPHAVNPDAVKSGSVKEWVKKLAEEIYELAEAELVYRNDKCVANREHFIREYCDCLTVLESFREWYGLSEREVSVAQEWVNQHNHERGYY